MHVKQTLPAGYALACTIDFARNRREFYLVNGLALLLAAVVAGAGVWFCPFSISIVSPWRYFFKLAVALVLMFAYIFAHELTHGAVMKAIGCARVNYGFQSLFAYAGAADFFSRRAYVCIALAPVVLWGVVLGICSALVPAGWFWVVWLVQLTNISGAAGDFYVALRTLRMDPALLVRDTGTAMAFYLPKGLA